MTWTEDQESAYHHMKYLMINDPGRLRRESDEKIIAEKGQEWLDANKKYLDADWEGIRSCIFGF